MSTLGRNTVRRYLRAETTEPVYADRRSPASLDKYAFKFSAWLKTGVRSHAGDDGMYIDLCASGYEGSYDRAAAFVRHWKVEQLERGKFARKSTFNARSALNRRPILSLGFVHTLVCIQSNYTFLFVRIAVLIRRIVELLAYNWI
jgi:hypothetical protein